jgi:tRNA (guanine-N7-)-methyltransferase
MADQEKFLLPLSDEVLDLADLWGAGTPVVVEIGFGTGLVTSQMAIEDPGTGILAIDIHTPGVGDLLYRVGDLGLTNVRVMEADALTVLERMIPQSSLAGVRTYFPDPWPKPRHHKRRLIQPEVLGLVADRLMSSGFWHVATDWDQYATAIESCFAADDRWTGGVIDRPAWRPQTGYEGRALRDGRGVTDLVYRTRPAATTQA